MGEHTRDGDVPGEAESIWLATTPETEYEALADGVAVDTAVVGGGITGLTTASLLAEAGHTVAVVEAGRIVEGVTGHTTAKLTSQHGLVYHDLIETFGEERARRYAEANEAAIDHVESRVEERDIDCDFARTSAYTYTDSPDHRRKVRREVDAARQLGLPASYVESTPLPYEVENAIRFDDQARFHPRKYLLALAAEIPGDGSYVFEETKATDIDPGRQCEVTTERGTITADNVVVATHFPVLDRAAYFARLSPKRSYVLAVRLAGEPPEGLFYRTGDPYFSVRPHPTDDDESLVLVGGQNHRTGHGGGTAERYRKVEREARERFDVESVEYRWSTQDFTSVDRVPLVGEMGAVARNVYVGTGFGGWGMSNGTAAGMVLADLVRGESNPWADVYDPTRFKPVASAGTLLSHNKHAAKHFVTDRFESREDVASLGDGEGSVVDGEDGPVAAYRNENGEVTAVSAVCTHMGCLVRWNDGERSWDCPCHGSRFDVDGSVIDTPAVEDLPRREP